MQIPANKGDIKHRLLFTITPSEWGSSGSKHPLAVPQAGTYSYYSKLPTPQALPYM